jgi:hypothetical protein
MVNRAETPDFLVSANQNGIRTGLHLSRRIWGGEAAFKNGFKTFCQLAVSPVFSPNPDASNSTVRELSGGAEFPGGVLPKHVELLS